VDIHKDLGELRGGFNADLLGHDQAIIHTRHATFGAKVAENSHPFSIKGIIGAHNGIIHNHASVAREHGIEYEVDSEVIFHAIADGIPLSELEGYGAVVFWQDGVFNIGRFNNGDMCLLATEFGWVFASTDKAVADALGMAGLGERAKYQVDLKQGVRYQLLGDRIVRAGRLDIASSSNKTTWQSSGTSSSSLSSTGHSSYGYWDKTKNIWVAKSGYESLVYGSVEWYKRWTMSPCSKRPECGCQICQPAAHAQAALPLPTADTTTFDPNNNVSSDDDEADYAGLLEDLQDTRTARAIEEFTELSAQQFRDSVEDDQCMWCGSNLAEDEKCYFDDDELCGQCFSTIPQQLIDMDDDNDDDDDNVIDAVDVSEENLDEYDLIQVDPDEPVECCTACGDILMPKNRAYQHNIYVKLLLCEDCYLAGRRQTHDGRSGVSNYPAAVIN
jgi:hypothetical protein